MNKEEFIIEVQKLGINLSEEQLEKLDKFYQILIEENQKINLTRITDEKEVYLKHFYDSLTLVKVVNFNKIETLCDVGSGAGFPGIVLKIVFPHLKVTLIDSLLKRVNYLNETIKKLELDNIKAIHTRSEDYSETFDIVTSRAVANISKLLTFTMHLVNKNGICAAMKGNIDQELTPEVMEQINRKYQIVNIEKFKLPIEESNRTIIVLKNK